MKPSLSKALTFILALLVLAIPFLSTYGLVTWVLRKSLLDFIPQWSDEVAYWHQTATFRLAGFNGGYYTINELSAPLNFIHFYVHGPLYPVLFGLLGKLIGWKFYYTPFLNILLMTLALVWYIFILKPKPIQLVFLGLSVLTFWPTLLFMPTNMRVGVFSAAAILLAVYFYKIIVSPQATSRFELAFFLLLIVIMSLFQVSWSLLFLPFLILLRKRLHLSLLASILISLGLLAVAYFLFDLLVAPYPLYFTSQFLSIMKDSFKAGLDFLLAHTLENLQNFFSPIQDPLWLALRIQMVLTILVSSVLLWKHSREPEWVRENLVVLLNCGLLVAETILLFDILHWRDYRLFGPVLLMVALTLVARKRWILVSGLLVINLILFPNFLDATKELLSGAFTGNQAAIQKFSQEIAPVVHYDASADPWDNTLLTSPEIAMHQYLLGVPAGIGLSWFINPDNLSTIKSRYLLLNKQDYEILRRRTCLDYMVSTQIGDLYLNERDQCNP